MRITSATEYATRLLAALARSYGSAPVTGESLSVAENIPQDYVNQILLRLKRDGIVESHRGISGGYALSRSPEKITLGQAVRAVEGAVFEDVCGKYQAGDKDCRHQSRCSISPVWQKLGMMIERYLDGVTIADVLAESARVPGGGAVENAFLAK